MNPEAIVQGLWALVGSTAGGALIACLARETILIRVKASVAAEFKRTHEKFVAELKWDEARRVKATQVADVIASWIAIDKDPDKKLSVAAYIEHQRLYWQLALWLDASTLRALNAALTHEQGASFKEALAMARSQIVGEEENPLRADELVHWKLP